MPSELETAVGEIQNEAHEESRWERLWKKLSGMEAKIAKASLSPSARSAAAKAAAALAPFASELGEVYTSLSGIAGDVVEDEETPAPETQPAKVEKAAKEEQPPAWVAELKKSIDEQAESSKALKAELETLKTANAATQKAARVAGLVPLAKALEMEADTLDVMVQSLPEAEAKKVLDGMARMTKLAKASGLMKEIGSEASNETNAGSDADAQLDAKAKEIMATDKLDYAQALSAASRQLNMGISSRNGGK